MTNFSGYDMKPAGKALFPIGTVAKACSVSRMCIIRMEEEGLIRPYYRNGDGGTRYYTTGDINRIMRVLAYQSFGLTRKEIRNMLQTQDGYKACMEKLENMQIHLKRVVEEMHTLYDTDKGPRVIMTEIPKRVFFKQESVISLDYRTIMNFADQTFQQALNRSLPIDWNGPMLLMNRNPEKMLETETQIQSGRIIACVPMSKELTGPDYLHHADGTAITVCWRSDTEDLRIGYQFLKKTLNERNLNSDAAPSLIITSNQQDTKSFFRLVQPLDTVMKEG